MLRRSKKVKGLVFNITSAYEYAEIEFTNPYEPKGINVKWSRQNQSIDFSSRGIDISWINTSNNEKNPNSWRVNFPNTSDSTLQLIVFKSKKGISYEKTLCRYSIETEISGKWKTIAEAEIDLGDYIDTNSMSTKIMIDLVPKPKYALKAVLLLDLKFEFLQSGDLPNYATLPRERPNKAKTIFNALKDSNEDVINLGAAKKHNMQEILCSDSIYLVINQSLEETNELFKVFKRFSSKTKLNRHEMELIYVSFMQNIEELTEIVKEESLAFPVISGSQMLKDVMSAFLTENGVHLLIITLDGEIMENISGVNSIKERLETEILVTNDVMSVSSFISSKQRCASSTAKTRTADILMQSEHKITVLQEEKDFLTSENAQLKLTLNRKKSEYDLKKVKEQDNVETEQNLEYKSKILQAERDVRTTLNKRGVSGMTGKKFRTRCFSCEDDSICYYDPITNKMKGHISLTKIESIEKAPREKQDRDGGLLYINTPDRVYEIQAQNDLHREKWMSAVEVLRGVVNDRVGRTETL